MILHINSEKSAYDPNAKSYEAEFESNEISSGYKGLSFRTETDNFSIDNENYMYMYFLYETSI